jgi:hypothetical protein
MFDWPRRQGQMKHAAGLAENHTGDCAMGKWQAALLTLVSLLFVGAGVFVLNVGDSDDTGGAWGMIAFFGGCAFVGVLSFVTANRKSPVNTPGTSELGPSAMTTLGYAVASIAFAAGCLALAVKIAEADWLVMAIGWFGAAFFGTGSIVLLLSLLKAKKWVYRLEDRQIVIASSNRQPEPYAIAWTDIVSIIPVTVATQRFLALTLRPEADAEARRWAPIATKANAAMNLPPICLSATAAGMSAEKFEQLIVQRWQQAALD